MDPDPESALRKMDPDPESDQRKMDPDPGQEDIFTVYCFLTKEFQNNFLKILSLC